MTVTPALTYLQPMQCGTCGTIMHIEETESTTIIVNVKGLPINSDTEEYEVKAKCPKCGREYDVEKNGMYFTLRNITKEICPTLQLEEDKDIGFGVEI